MRDDLLGVRDEFPQLEKFKAYLNTASEGLTPKRVKRVIAEWFDKITNSDLSFGDALKAIGECKRVVAEFIGASPEEVSLTDSTTTGLKAALRSIGFKHGDNVVTFDQEYIATSTFLFSLKRAKGVEVRVAKHVNGFYDYDAVRKLIDDNTRAVVVSSIQWATGLRMNLKLLRELADEVGAYLVVDGIQHVGALKFDVNEARVDFLAVGSGKWLMAPYVGCGFLYVSKRILDEVEDPPYGVLNCEEPSEGWAKYWANPFKDPWSNPLKPLKTAGKFDWGGMPPVLGVVALTEAVKYLAEIGISKIEEWNLKLKEILVEELEKIGVEFVALLENRKDWTQVTLIRLNRDFDYHVKLLNYLKSWQIAVSLRGIASLWGLRVSTHIYNTPADIECLVEALKKFH